MRHLLKRPLSLYDTLLPLQQQPTEKNDKHHRPRYGRLAPDRSGSLNVRTPRPAPDWAGAQGPDPDRSGKLMFVPYRCLQNKRTSKPYDFIEFGAAEVTKPYDFIWFGDIHGPKP